MDKASTLFKPEIRKCNHLSGHCFEVKWHEHLKGLCHLCKWHLHDQPVIDSTVFTTLAIVPHSNMLLGKTSLVVSEIEVFSELEVISEKIRCLPSIDFFLPALRNSILSPRPAATERPLGGRTVIGWLSGNDQC